MKQLVLVVGVRKPDDREMDMVKRFGYQDIFLNRNLTVSDAMTADVLVEAVFTLNEYRVPR